MAAPVPVITLTTTERKTIAIDHVAYVLRALDDLSLSQLQDVERLSPQIARMLALETLTAAQEQALGAMLTRITEIAVDAPADVLAKQGMFNRMMIFRVFSDLLLPSLQAAGATAEAFEQTNPSPIGTTSSPSLSGSTAAPSARGSKKRRSRSSARR